MTDVPDRDPARVRAEFEEFYRAQFDPARRWVHRQDPTLDDQEIVNEAFTRTWKRWCTLTGPPRQYLFRIIRNLMAEARKKSTVPPIPPDERHRALVAPVEDFETRQRLKELSDDIDALPEHLRQALLLRYDGMSVKEIAEAMGCDPRSVSTYLWKARKELSRHNRPTAPGNGPGTGARHDDRGDTW